MTDKKAPRYTPEDRLLAFKLWLDHGKPQWRALADIFNKETGYNVQFSTLYNWSAANREWMEAIVDSKPMKPERILAALAAAKEDAAQIEADHFKGVKAQMVCRLYESVKELPLKTIDDWTRALDCCEKIEAHIHAERGKALLEAGPSVVTSLMDRMVPNVQLQPFKKLNGKAGS